MVDTRIRYPQTLTIRCRRCRRAWSQVAHNANELEETAKAGVYVVDAHNRGCRGETTSFWTEGDHHAAT